MWLGRTRDERSGECDSDIFSVVHSAHGVSGCTVSFAEKREEKEMRWTVVVMTLGFFGLVAYAMNLRHVIKKMKLEKENMKSVLMILVLPVLLSGCVGCEQVDEGYRGIESNFGKVVGEPLSIAHSSGTVWGDGGITNCEACSGTGRVYISMESVKYRSSIYAKTLMKIKKALMVKK